jgi:hypothetical protein
MTVVAIIFVLGLSVSVVRLIRAYGCWPVAFLATVNRCTLLFHPLAWRVRKHPSELVERAADTEGAIAAPVRMPRSVLAAVVLGALPLLYTVALGQIAVKPAGQVPPLKGSTGVGPESDLLKDLLVRGWNLSGTARKRTGGAALREIRRRRAARALNELLLPADEDR